MKKTGSLFVGIAIVVLLVYALGAGAALMGRRPVAQENTGVTVTEDVNVTGTEGVSSSLSEDYADTMLQGMETDGANIVTEGEPSHTPNAPTQPGRYCYDALSVEEQLWYQDMYAVLSGMYREVPLSAAGNESVGEQGIDKIFQCVMNDHPE